jgi:glycosidase
LYLANHPGIRGAAVCLLAVLGLFAVRAGGQSATNEFWQRQSIYQIITDRFYDGDAGNNNADGNYDPAGRRGTSVHGGDFRGIEQKLDYVQALGATAIWISPVVLNAWGEFHGYAGRDFYKVDPHWGSLADLQHMVQAAHARGILVIDDVIVNHGGDLIDSGEAGYPRFRYPPGGYKLRYRNPARQYPPPFDLNETNRTLEALFHNQGVIQNYGDATQTELGELSGLDDFRTESDYVRARMAEIYEYWIGEAGFDGFRIDTVKHVEMGFWRSWCPAVRAYAAAHGKPNFFMFGEALEGANAKCASYAGTKGGGPFKLDSMLDYPLYFKMNNVFARGVGNTREIANQETEAAADYEPGIRGQLVTFLDNHDQPRFLSRELANDNQARLRLALVFLYTAGGIPCLYYGTEQGFDGGKDPYDREDMFAGQFEQGPSLGDNFNMTHPLFQWVARLNNFRRLYPALQTGSQTNLWSTAAGPGLLAYARRLGQQEVLVVLNTAKGGQTLPGCPTILRAGTRLANLFDTNETVPVLPGGRTAPITVGGTSAKIFVEESQVQPLDPVVVESMPAHDSGNVSADAPVILRFSQPMETKSVEAAFSATPPMEGTFSWSPGHDRMTFTCRGAGFPAQTLVAMQLASGARDAVSGGKLRGGFELRFRTGAERPRAPTAELPK